MINAGKALGRFAGWFYSGVLMAVIAMAAGALAAVYAPPAKAFAAYALGIGLTTIWLLNISGDAVKTILDEGREDVVAWGIERFLPVVGGLALGYVLAGPVFKEIIS